MFLIYSKQVLALYLLVFILYKGSNNGNSRKKILNLSTILFECFVNGFPTNKLTIGLKLGNIRCNILNNSFLVGNLSAISHTE